MKKLTIIFLLFISIFATGAKSYVGLSEIDPVCNATRHNNLGLQYLEAKDYYSAIQEFKIAISLNPTTQASAVYYTNLANTYILIGEYKYAQDCFERALILNPLNFNYYQNLVEAYNLNGELELRKKQLKFSHKSLDMITLGLIYIAQNNLTAGLTTLDNFVMTEPDLLITDGVKIYLKNFMKKPRRNH